MCDCSSFWILVLFSLVVSSAVAFVYIQSYVLWNLIVWRVMPCRLTLPIHIVCPRVMQCCDAH